MMSGNALLQRLAEVQQDRQADLALLKRSVGRESITGNEANFVRLLREEMDARGLGPREEAFQPGRPNIWGERRGRGGGPRLLFIGHTDTVHVRGWREKWAGTERENPFGCAEVDGQVWGRGVGDLKGGICASLAALDLLDQAGISLKGDVAYAFVGDEESGEEGSGVSAGIDHWSGKVNAGEIERPDFAIYVEPTNLSVYTAQIGFFIADVTVTGKSAYFGRPELGIDALKATHSILESVWNFAGQLERLEPHELTGRSSVLVTSVEAGGYIAVPGDARFSVIGTLRPGDDLDKVIGGFEKAVHGATVPDGISVAIRYPAGRDHPRGGSAVEIDRSLPQVRMLKDAIGETIGSESTIGGAPYWSETPFIVNRLDCPAVYCAPGDISNCHTLEERLEIDEYLAAIRAFALFMTRFCGVAATRDPTKTGRKT